MKKGLFVVLLICIGTFLFAQENPVCEWAKKKVIVDGNASEWNLPLKNYDTDTKLFFDFKNDSNNLYLCFQTKDEMTEAKIMRSGMKIILSNKINGKHKSIIDFPMPASKSAESKDEIQPDLMATRPNRHIAFLSKDTLMEVKGFATENGTISSQDTTGIHPAINWDSTKTFTYEIAIPLREMFGNDYAIKDLSKGISLDIVINAMATGKGSKNSGSENGFSERGRGEGDRGGRMGGSGYGGMRGGRNRMGDQENGQLQEDRSAMFQKAELKQKIILATSE